MNCPTHGSRFLILLAVTAGLSAGALIAADEKPASDSLDQRVLRWSVAFDTANGEDYARQLHALGAILAVPEDESKYRVFRDLKSRPAKGKIEDLKTIKRIFWVDDEPMSVKGLATALQLPQVPKAIIAYFPEQLEQEMARLERAFAKDRGHKVETIAKSRFRVVKQGETYTVAIIDIQPKK